MKEKILNIFSIGRFMSLFFKLLLPIKPIKDEIILNLMMNNIKKIGFKPRSIGTLNSKNEIKGLSQMMVIGDIRNENSVVVVISEKRLHDISNIELEGQLALATAESQYIYQARYNLIYILPMFLLFLNFIVQAFTRQSMPIGYVTLFNSYFNSVIFISLLTSYFVIERLKHIGIYSSAIRSFNIKIETIILLKNNFMKKYSKLPRLVLFLEWVKFLSPNQIKQLKNIIDTKTDIDFIYMIKFFFKNPIIFINIFTMMAALFITFFG